MKYSNAIKRYSKAKTSSNKEKLSLNQRQEELGRRKQEVEQAQVRVDNEKKILVTKQAELEKMQTQERAKLEELSGLSAEDAKNRLIESLKDEAKTNAASYINEIMDEAKLMQMHKLRKLLFKPYNV